jgi:hypothetical protein
MKQIWPTYAYSPTTNVLTLTGLNIDRDQLLLVTAADRGRIMYNFADSSVTASAFTSGANTALTLVATTAGLTTTAALVIYYDDQATSSTVTGTVELGPTSLNALESITVTMGQVTVTGGLTDVQLRASAVTVGGTVTVGNSLTISSLPAISGTVTANLGNVAGTPLDNPPSHAVRIGWASEDTLRSAGVDNGGEPLPIQIYLGNSSADNVTTANPLPISGTVTIGSALPAGTNRIGVVTIGAGTVTLGAGTAQIGSVTASISNFPATQPVSLTTLPALVAGTAQIGSVTASISGTVPISISSVTIGNSVTIGSLPALAAGTAQIGSVTASISANPSGALTTRFGSVTTANTAQITTAVTNTSRKYLFAQNISIGSVTMGIGFSPTTTQGIQLSAGSGIVFDSFCPTGAVYWLGATTGAAWSILEG